MREVKGSLEQKCPFCRLPVPVMEGEANFCVMKRIEANDPVALWQMGESTHLKGDYSSAFGYWTKAAELGNVGAHCSLADMNHHGIGV